MLTVGFLHMALSWGACFYCWLMAHRVARNAPGMRDDHS
jgi:hypothetical protein